MFLLATVKAESGVLIQPLNVTSVYALGQQRIETESFSYNTNYRNNQTVLQLFLSISKKTDLWRLC